MGLYHVLMNVRTYAHTYVHAYVCTNEPTRMHGCTSINAWMGWRMYCNVMYWKLECKATQCSAMVGYGLVWYGTARYGMYIWSHTHTHTHWTTDLQKMTSFPLKKDLTTMLYRTVVTKSLKITCTHSKAAACPLALMSQGAIEHFMGFTENASPKMLRSGSPTPPGRSSCQKAQAVQK